MKKILITLLLLFIPFIVNALEASDYSFAWDTEFDDIAFPYDYDYKDGYLFVNYDPDNKFSMSYFDKKGNELKTKAINGLVIGVIPDDYIYVVIEKDLSNTESEIIAQAYNDKLELVNETVLIHYMTNSTIPFHFVSNPIYLNNKIDQYIQIYKRFYEMDVLSYFFQIKDNQIVTFGANINASSEESIDDPAEIANYISAEKRFYKKDLSSYEKETIDILEVINTLGELEQTTDPKPAIKNFVIELLGIEEFPIILDGEIEDILGINNHESVVDYTITNDYATVTLKQCEGDNYYCIRVYDLKTKHVVIEKGVNNVTTVGKIVDGYLMIAYNEPSDGNYETSSRIKSTLRIYDLKTKELLHEISGTDGTKIAGIIDTKRGMILEESTCGTTYSPFIYGTSNTPSGKILPTYLVRETCTSVRSVYHYYKQVDTKIASGKGQIIVDERYSPNDPVTFTIVPEKGYVLSSVKVTDANGNVITFTDYTFTMPDANVLIEATFVTNPNTSSFISYLVIVLGGIAFITTYLLIQKKKALKIKW